MLTLQRPELSPEPALEEPSTSSGLAVATAGLAVATSPPRAKLVDEVEMSEYVLKRRTLVIRRVS